MPDDPQAFLPLAESIAEGSPIDWDAVEAGTTLEDQLVLRQMRVLWSLAQLHRSHADQPDAAPSRDTTRPGVPAATLGTWAHLSLVDRLGVGSFGEVFRAWDPHLEREVALKLLRGNVLADLETSRVAREGRLLARLRHPSIVTVYGVTVHEQRVGLWMELIRGVTLEQALVAHGPFSAREASLIGVDVCGALAAVHAAGLIHRDVKAQNVMREDGGRVILMDFGTGREINPPQGHLLPEVAGTPLYVAPEIFAGEPASIRSDVYGVGVLLYHLVTGSFPVRETSVDDLRRALALGTGVRLRDARPDLPVGFVRVVTQAIASDPERRHQTVGDLETELLQALEEDSGRARTAVGPRSTRVPSIAVLPFTDMNRERNLEYFGDGIAEEITNALAQIRGLRVAARTSAFQFKGRAEDIRRVGDALNVETVLEGSVRATGSRLRIITQLSNTTTGFQLWSERFERDLEDVFAVQDEIADAVVRTLRVQLGDRPSGTSPETTNVAAYASYLKGRYCWNKRTEDGLLKSVALFTRALEHDPAYAKAYAGLADAYVTLAIYGALRPDEAMPKARAAAERALALSDTLADVHTSLGCLSAAYDWAWGDAERSFRRAIELSPDYATAHHWYAVNVLAPQRRFTEARTELRVALDLDPLSRPIGASIGLLAFFARRYPEAVEEFLRTLELDAEFAVAHFFLGQTYVEMGRHDQAIESIETALRLSGRSPEMMASLGYAFGRAGQHERARAVLAELTTVAERRYVSPSLFAQVHVGLGDVSTGLDWLEQSAAERAADLTWIAVRPAFDLLHGEPRFNAVCETIGLASAT